MLCCNAVIATGTGRAEQPCCNGRTGGFIRHGAWRGWLIYKRRLCPQPGATLFDSYDLPMSLYMRQHAHAELADHENMGSLLDTLEQRGFVE